MKKGVFLIDAVLSSTYILLLLLVAVGALQLYSSGLRSYVASEEVGKALILSNDLIATGSSGKGDLCVLRYYEGKKVYCYEDD